MSGSIVPSNVDASAVPRPTAESPSTSSSAGFDPFWSQVDQYARNIHATLELVPVAYTIANEIRRLLACDRVTVVVRHGRRYRVLAVSGADSVHPRANAVRLLEELASVVMLTQEPLWWNGEAARRPPQIERPLVAWLDEGDARAVGILPLMARDADETAPPPGCVGALVVENFSQTFPATLPGQTTIAGRHAAVALRNALDHCAVPKWLRWAGRPGAALRSASSPRMCAALVLLFFVTAAFVLVPAELTIEARGELQPAVRRDIFAPADGVIVQLPAEHQSRVAAGETLVVLRDPQLELEFTRVLGEQQTVLKKLAAVQASRLQQGTAVTDRVDEYGRLTAEEEELKVQLESLERQHAILERQRAALTVASSIDGQVLNWNLAKTLFGRPVRRGALLMNVADVDGPWVVELRIPDHRVGHVVAARQQTETPLDVSCVIAAEPGRPFHRPLEEIGETTEIDAEGRPIVRGLVRIDRRDNFRPGATVHARIACGTRSLGYVWFHELIEAVQRRLLF